MADLAAAETASGPPSASAGAAAGSERVPLASRQALLTCAGMFVLSGMLIGGYGGVLPSLQLRLGLGAREVAILLLAGGLAAVVGMQVGGRITDAVGPRCVVLAGVPGMVAGACVIATAPSFALALAGAALLGLGGGAMDVSMNALAVQIERARSAAGTGGAVLSFLHALWSVGNFAGAGFALAFSATFALRGAALVAPVLLFVAAVGALGGCVLAVVAPSGEKLARVASGRSSAHPQAAYLLGATAFGCGLAEGTAADWSSIDVTEIAHVDAAVGSLGLVAVSACMVLARFLGDRLVDRHGRRRVVRVGAVCAAVGYLVVSAVHPLPLLVLGWAVVGLGVGGLAPQVYGSAGHLGGGRALAVVVTFGYAGFLAGPAAIGWSARYVGLQHTMVLPALLCLAVVFLAGALPAKQATAT